MSTYDHDYFGMPRKFVVHTAGQLLSSKPKRVVVLEHFLDLGTTLRALVEDEVNHRFFALLLAISIAAGIDFGIYRSKGPRKVHVVWGAGHFEADWHRIKVILAMPEFDAARAVIECNLSNYHRDHEQDPPVDLGHQEAQEAMRRSMPADTEVVVIVDWVPEFIRKRMGKLLPISPYGWFHELNKEGIAVVAFDQLRKSDMGTQSEAVAAATAFLTKDSNAPSQFGDGFLLERGRVGDADYASRKSSFWHTEIGGELEYGFFLADPDDAEKPAEIRKTEREIKFEVMLAERVPLKDIAKEFDVHKSTITRWKQELQAAAEVAAKHEMLNPTSPQNRWDNVFQLGKLIRQGKPSTGQDEDDAPPF